MVFLPLPAVATAAVAPSAAGMVSGVLNTFRQVGGALGLAILVTVAAALNDGAAVLPGYRGALLVSAGLVAALVLVCTLPLTLASALAVRLGSPGPIFYRAARAGVGGAPFAMLKFRTMHVAAHQGPEITAPNDARIFRAGALLRKLKLDELPQFINVLRGEMSIVGPRPPLRREVERYDGVVSRRLLVKPGVTGLWQVSGRSDLSWEESVRLDLSYVENWSITHDLMIMWKTARAVLSSDGAY